MERLPYDPYQAQTNAKGPPAAVVVLLSLAIAAAVLVGLLLLIRERRVLLQVRSGGETLPAEDVTATDYPSALVQQIPQPAGDLWLLPVTAVTVDGAIVVLDAGNGRILKLDSEGGVTAVFDKASDQRLDLQQPTAMATDGTRLFVANSLAASVTVLDLSGRVENVLTLQPLEASERTPRPIGIAVAPDGTIIVSDANNDRVLFLDSEGHVVKTVGTGTRAAGRDGFNVPGSLTVDSAGNIYVVDTLNGRVVELSPEGAFLRQFGRLGSTAGALSRPKGVAVDAAGRVYVSDGLEAAIQVFDADGAFLGIIGRQQTGDSAGGSLFQAPAGLWLAGDKLYVTDRFAGLFVLRLPGATAGAK